MMSRRSFFICLAGAANLSARPSSAAPEPFKIAFVGDSMADGVWGGVQRRISKDPCWRQLLRAGRYAEIGTGLSRADKFNWASKVKAISAEFQPDILVVSFGLNDRTPIVEPGSTKRIETSNPEWIFAYERQVLTFLAAAKSSSTGVMWLGIPVLRDNAANRDALVKNKVFADALAKMKDERFIFIDPWRLTTSAEDTYNSYYTNEAGYRVQLRATDGIHFTSAGYDLIGSYIWPRMVDHLFTRVRALNTEVPCR
jgi:hypothetical protein